MAQSIIESRTLDPVLTTLAHGYCANHFVADKLFPTVQINRSHGKIPMFDKSEFLSRKTERAKSALSNRIPVEEHTYIDFQTVERDIEVAIDYLDEMELNHIYKYEQRTVQRLQDILLLDKELIAADLATNTSYYSADAQMALSQGNDFSSALDPISFLQQGKEAVREQIGIYPNTLILSDKAYLGLKTNPSLLDKIKYSGINKIATGIISELTDITNIHIAQAQKADLDGIFADVWDNCAVLAYVDYRTKETRSAFNPSFGYCMQIEGMPEVDSYTENGGKIKVIRNTDNYCIKVTGRDASFLITNCYTKA